MGTMTCRMPFFRGFQRWRSVFLVRVHLRLYMRSLRAQWPVSACIKKRDEVTMRWNAIRVPFAFFVERPRTYSRGEIACKTKGTWRAITRRTWTETGNIKRLSLHSSRAESSFARRSNRFYSIFKYSFYGLLREKRSCGFRYLLNGNVLMLSKIMAMWGIRLKGFTRL